MKSYAIINLSIIPIRIEPSDKAEIVTQGIFGELVTIIDQQKQWLKIELHDDLYQGWIDEKQITFISKDVYYKISSLPKTFVGEYITFAFNKQNQTAITLPLGAQLPFYHDNTFRIGDSEYQIESDIVKDQQSIEKMISLSHLFINTPYLWGGKCIFGIDCSGFTQLVYKICGYNIPRDAYQQAEMGTALSFIEEAEPGDLAFFDNEEGHIIHVGIILNENRIIHAHGKVRIDYLDHSGIFNVDTQKHSHKLRVIKRLFSSSSGEI